MRKEKTITVGDNEITVRELTVDQVTNVMDGLEGAKTSVFDLLLPDRLPAVAVCAATDLTLPKLKKMVPSDLVQIWDAVEEVNPFFVGMVERLASLGAAALGAGDLSAETQQKPAAI